MARICDAEQYEEQCKKELSGSVRGLYESLVEKSRGKLHKAQQRRNTEMLQADQPPSSQRPGRRSCSHIPDWRERKPTEGKKVMIPLNIVNSLNILILRQYYKKH